MKNLKNLSCVCLLIVGAGMNHAYAQCVEVKKVETKRTMYDESYGYTFTNLNGYEVTIEAELWSAGEQIEDRTTRPWTYTFIPEKIVTTKTFVIGAKSDYLWKTDLSSVARYFVKFKAFKCP